jgi:hypothetical protein
MATTALKPQEALAKLTASLNKMVDEMPDNRVEEVSKRLDEMLTESRACQQRHRETER